MADGFCYLDQIAKKSRACLVDFGTSRFLEVLSKTCQCSILDLTIGLDGHTCLWDDHYLLYCLHKIEKIATK